MFITFEGIDGCGKSTQIKLLEEYFDLYGKEYISTREPGGTKIGTKIRKILLEPNIDEEMWSISEILLNSAARMQNIYNKIIPALKEGKHIICDRFYDSTKAYQGIGLYNNELIDFLTDLTKKEHAIPDFTFIIDLTIDEQIRRLKGTTKDRIELNGRSYFEGVRKRYLKIAEKEDDRVILIDGSLSRDEIHRIIIETIKDKI